MTAPFFAPENGGIPHGKRQAQSVGTQASDPILARLDRIEALLRDIAPLVTRKETQAEHAKRIGISRRALVYRLSRARAKQAVKSVSL